MNTEELAQVFDGIAKGLSAGLKEREKKELATLVVMFRRFPNQGIGDFVKFVEGSFAKEKNSVPALIERIKAYQQGDGEPKENLGDSIRSLAATELKKLVVALGLKASARKEENLRVFDSILSGHPTSDLNGHAETFNSEEVDSAYKIYEDIKRDLRMISVDEMRSRFASLAGLAKPVLAGLLKKLGYPAEGSREKLAAQLLDNLTSIKISFDQTQNIK